MNALNASSSSSSSSPCIFIRFSHHVKLFCKVSATRTGARFYDQMGVYWSQKDEDIESLQVRDGRYKKNSLLNCQIRESNP